MTITVQGSIDAGALGRQSSTSFDGTESIVTFLDGDPDMTASAITAAQAVFDAAIVANQYKRDREYGSVEDQLDMLYWDQVNSTTTFKDHVAAVKASHPKGDN